MDPIGAIWPASPSIIGEPSEVGGECVSVKEQHVMRVDRADGSEDAVVEADETGVFWVGRLVHDVVSCNPGIVNIMLRDFGPEPDEPVLKILVDPEACDMRAMVGVPSAVLATRGGMHVDDGIDGVAGAYIDDTVEVLKSFGLQDHRVHVIFKVPIVDRDTNAVEAERSEKFGVWLREEILEELASRLRLLASK